MADEQPERRAGMHVLHAEVGRLEGRLEGLDRTVDEVKQGLHSLRADLVEAVRDALRAPGAQVAAGNRQLWVAVGTLLVIISLIVGPIYADLSKMREHRDGHPEWVTKLMAEQFKSVLKEIGSVQTTHSLADNKQEHAIGELHVVDMGFEARIDEQGNRLTKLEAQMTERTSRFHELIGLRAADRYSLTMHELYAGAIEKRLAALEGKE